MAGQDVPTYTVIIGNCTPLRGPTNETAAITSYGCSVWYRSYGEGHQDLFLIIELMNAAFELHVVLAMNVVKAVAPL